MYIHQARACWKIFYAQLYGDRDKWWFRRVCSCFHTSYSWNTQVKKPFYVQFAISLFTQVDYPPLKVFWIAFHVYSNISEGDKCLVSSTIVSKFDICFIHSKLRHSRHDWLNIWIFEYLNIFSTKKIKWREVSIILKTAVN